MSHAYPADAAAAVRHGLTLTVDNEELIDSLAAEAGLAGITAPVHIKVDTGLHRFGLEPERAVELAEYARATAGIEVEGLWTHMANADEADDSFSERQYVAFESVRKQLPWIPYAHAGNSATAMRRPELRYNGVRTGLALHGVLPANTPGEGFAPTLTLKALLARVLTVEAGEGVSYGLAWTAPRRSTVGLVPLGYGDGLPRSLGNRGWVLAGGELAPMVGRMCMDHLAVDLTDVPGNPSAGDEVVVLGRQGERSITADDLAEQAGTISWEILTGMQARVARVYHRAGAVETTT
jgi:alanine racemase